MIDTDYLACEVSPLRRLAHAASMPKPASAPKEPRLRCPECRHQESARLRHPGTALRRPHHLSAA